jgi:hypothetical protein
MMAALLLQGLPGKAPTLYRRMGAAGEPAVHLLSRLLSFEPRHRASAGEALSHEYFFEADPGRAGGRQPARPGASVSRFPFTALVFFSPNWYHLPAYRLGHIPHQASSGFATLLAAVFTVGFFLVAVACCLQAVDAGGASLQTAISRNFGCLCFLATA